MARLGAAKFEELDVDSLFKMYKAQIEPVKAYFYIFIVTILVYSQ